MPAVKKVDDVFYVKIDTDYDLFGGAGGSSFEAFYLEDGSLTSTTITNNFSEIILPITTPVTDTTSGTTNAGAKFITVTTTPNLEAGDVFEVTGSGTAATGTISDANGTPLQLTVTMHESLGDQGNIDITIRDLIDGAVGGCNGTWDESTSTLYLDIEDGVSTDTEIQAEILTFDSIVNTCTGAAGSSWTMHGDANDTTTLASGADPEMYYVESVTTSSPYRIYTRKSITDAITGGVTLTQVGNTGVYRVALSISTPGDYTVIVRNPTINMQNVAQAVQIIAEDLTDAHTKLDTLVAAAGSDRQYFRGFI